MRTGTTLGIILLVLSSSLPLAVWYSETIIIDTSWTSSVTQYLKSAQPYPQWKEEYNLNAYTITLFEDGTNTFVNATNGDSFSSHLLNVLARADTKINDSVSDGFVSNVTQNYKVVYLRSRLGTNFIQAGTFVWDTYFVLEDNLNQGLQGTIFIEHDFNNVRTWQHWAITNPLTPSISPSSTQLTAHLAESTSAVNFGSTINFTVTVEGGKAPYTYLWNIEQS